MIAVEVSMYIDGQKHVWNHGTAFCCAARLCTGMTLVSNGITRIRKWFYECSVITHRLTLISLCFVVEDIWRYVINIKKICFCNWNVFQMCVGEMYVLPSCTCCTYCTCGHHRIIYVVNETETNVLGRTNSPTGSYWRRWIGWISPYISNYIAQYSHMWSR